MQDKLVKLCHLYENVSKTSGKRYFGGTLSFTSKLLILQNENARPREPQWTVFLAKREPKQQLQADEIQDPGEPVRRWQSRPF
jgi:hypothetical protein